MRHPPYPYPMLTWMQCCRSWRTWKDIASLSHRKWLGSNDCHVLKKEVSIRLCVDFRWLNSVTQTDAYTIPSLDDMFDQVESTCYITTLHLTQCYCQIPLAADVCKKTAFLTPTGLHQFKGLPFGLCGAPGTFPWLMDQLLCGLGSYLAVFLDDTIIYSNLWEEKRPYLFCFWLSQVYQSHCDAQQMFSLPWPNVIGNCVIRPLTSKVEAIETIPVHLTREEVRSLLGLTAWILSSVYFPCSMPPSQLLYQTTPRRMNWVKSTG